MKKVVYLVSDATGDTAEKVLKACMVQFEYKDGDIDIVRVPNTRTFEQVHCIIDEVSLNSGLIVFTLVERGLREEFISYANVKRVLYVDLMGGLMASLKEYLHEEPELKPGLLHRMDNCYFERMEAMEYSISHDDGVGLETIKEADVVLIGLSRTSKTPLSMFLASLGIKVANIPYLYGIELPDEVFIFKDYGKVFALIIAPDVLIERRKARIRARNYHFSSYYTDLNNVCKETKEFELFCRRNKHWRVLDATNKSIEELAFDIRSYIGRVRNVRM